MSSNGTSEKTKESLLERMQGVLERTLMPISEKMSKQRHLAALRDGMMLMIPATIVGGISMILAMPPVDASMPVNNVFAAFLVAWKTWATANMGILITPYTMTIGIISVYVSAGVAYSLAKSYRMNPITNVISALIVLFVVTATGATTADGVQVNTIAGLGTSSMFFAMVSALVVVEIDLWFERRNITIKMPDVVPPAVSGAFSILFPVITNTVLFVLLDVACTALTGAGLANLMTSIFKPLVGAVNTLPGILLIMFLNTTFWFFGIHPTGITGSITTPLATLGLTANAEAYAAGQAMPYVFAGNVFAIFGNWTTYLSICVLMMFACKSAQLKGLSKVAIGPSIFDINEPLIFGIPTMLNVLMYIPLVICGGVDFTLAYLLMDAGLVSKFYLNIPAFLPVPLAAFMSALDWRALLLWVIEFLIDMVIMFPFLKTYDKQLCMAEARTAKAGSVDTGE